MNVQIELDNLMQFTPEQRARILMTIVRNILRQAEEDPWLVRNEIEAHVLCACQGERP